MCVYFSHLKEEVVTNDFSRAVCVLAVVVVVVVVVVIVIISEESEQQADDAGMEINGL